jgi:hypothetical protein
MCVCIRKIDRQNFCLKEVKQLGVVVYTYNPSTGKAKAGVLQVQSQSGLHSKTLSKKQ